MNFLAAGPAGQSHSAIRTRLAAVSSVVNWFRDSPVRESELMMSFLRGARRAAPAPRRYVDSAPSIATFWSQVSPVLSRRWNEMGSRPQVSAARDHALFLVTLDTLARVGDVAGLAQSDVELHGDGPTSSVLVVRFRDGKSQTMGALPAGSQSRPSSIRCTLPHYSCTVCAVQLYARLLERVPASPHASAFSTLPFFRGTAEHLAPDTCRAAIRRTLAAAGLAVPPHALRGMVATTLIALGWSVESVASAGRWARRSGAATVRTHYEGDAVVARASLPPLAQLADVRPVGADCPEGVSAALRRCLVVESVNDGV